MCFLIACKYSRTYKQVWYSCLISFNTLQVVSESIAAKHIAAKHMYITSIFIRLLSIRNMHASNQDVGGLRKTSRGVLINTHNKIKTLHGGEN